MKSKIQKIINRGQGRFRAAVDSDILTCSITHAIRLMPIQMVRLGNEEFLFEPAEWVDLGNFISRLIDRIR